MSLTPVSFLCFRLSFFSKALFCGLLVCSSVAGFSQEQPKLPTILGTIQFHPDSTILAGARLNGLLQVARDLKSKPGTRLLIKGYLADTTQSARETTGKREIFVREKLIREGIPASSSQIPAGYTGGDPTKVDIFIAGTGTLPKPMF